MSKQMTLNFLKLHASSYEDLQKHLNHQMLSRDTNHSAFTSLDFL